MGRNEGTVELLVKVWEGLRKFLEVLNESTGSFFRQMRVPLTDPSILFLRHKIVGLELFSTVSHFTKPRGFSCPTKSDFKNCNSLKK